MPITADRETVQRLVADGDAQLVEVLPRDEYDEEHLPARCTGRSASSTRRVRRLSTAVDRSSCTAGTRFET